MDIIGVPILKSALNNTNVTAGQLIYCKDTLEAYFDFSNNDGTQRISLSNTRQLSIEASKSNLSTIDDKCIYIIVSTNRIYRHKSSEWIQIETYSDCEDLIFSSGNLEPVTLQQEGTNVAPLTLAKYVFNSDGTTAEDRINELLEKGKKVTLQKKTSYVTMDYDGQRIVLIPFPTSNYDLTRFPLFVIANNKFVNEDKYAISNEQIIFSQDISDTIRKGDVIKIIFTWANTESSTESVDADTIGGVRMVVGGHQPSSPTPNDMWFDTTGPAIKIWDGYSWVLFMDKKKEVQRIKKVVSLYAAASYIPIGVSSYNKDTDSLLVFHEKQYLDEGTDYTIDLTSSGISSKDGSEWCADGEPTSFTFIIFKNMSEFNIDNDIPDSIANDTLALTKAINDYMTTGSCTDVSLEGTEEDAGNVLSMVADVLVNGSSEDKELTIQANDIEEVAYIITNYLLSSSEE